MLELMKRRTIDLLVEQFWKQGYLTISRKYGTYLPEPNKVGGFDVDIIGRQKSNYAIGVILTIEDLNQPNILERLKFLATRQTKFTNRKVMLFVGTHVDNYSIAKSILEKLEPDVRKNIRLFPINDRPIISNRKTQSKNKTLFS